MGSYMSEKLLYTIPCLPPSLNKFLGRTNVWSYRKEKEIFTKIMTSSCRPVPCEPIKSALVTITFCCGDRRRRDYDNYLKFIFDGLVVSRVITDDSMSVIDVNLRLSFIKKVKKPFLKIEIEGHTIGETKQN